MAPSGQADSYQPNRSTLDPVLARGHPGGLILNIFDGGLAAMGDKTPKRPPKPKKPKKPAQT